MRPACPIMALALFQHLFTLIPRGFTCSGGGMRSRDSWLHRTGIVFLALEGHVESCSSGGHLFADLWRWSSSGSGLFGYDSGQQTRGCCLAWHEESHMRVLLKAADCAFWLSQAVLFCSITEAVVVYHSFAYWSLLDCRAATQALSHPEDESSDGFTTQYSESQVSLAVNIRSSPGCDAATCQVRPGTRIVQEIVSVPFELWCFLSFLVFSYNCQVGHVQGKLVPAQRWGHGIFWYYLTLSCLTSDF